MRVVFMGTPPFAAAILEDIALHHEIVAVFTRPDAVRDRGKTLQASAVKEMAQNLNLPVVTPQNLGDSQAFQVLKDCNPDIICVAAYGALLPESVLSLPRFGCVNVHASLLPRWRGAAPVERAILAGDKEVGVCIMRMETGLDTGPYCVRRAMPVDGIYADELTSELATLGASALLVALAHIEYGAVKWTLQDEAQVTWAPKIKKGELDIDVHLGAVQNARRVQASSAAHVSRTNIAGRSLTLLRAVDVSNDEDVLAATSSLVPGQACFIKKRLFLACESGVLEVLELKPDGKKQMDAKSFAAGIPSLREGAVTWGDIT